MPHAPPKWGIVLGILGTLILSACGGASPAAAPTAAPSINAGLARGGEGGSSQQFTSNTDYPASAPAAAPTAAPAATAAPVSAAPEPAAAPATGGAASPDSPVAAPPVIGDPSRKIIKDAQMSLEVTDVDLALSRVNGIAAQSGGYVLETSTSFDTYNRKTAYIRITVLVDEFEAALQRLREGANQILSEQASGVDVTQEFTDVQSQIANLEATQARIREFLDQAKTVEEALKVNAQLNGQPIQPSPSSCNCPRHQHLHPNRRPRRHQHRHVCQSGSRKKLLPRLRIPCWRLCKALQRCFCGLRL
jgi:Domain of unknown function (DUF4349)